MYRAEQVEAMQRRRIVVDGGREGGREGINWMESKRRWRRWRRWIE